MKKTILAAGASLALATMPAVGVFAADITTMTDTLSLTMPTSCAWTSTTGNTVALSGTAFTAALKTSSTYTHTLKCNVYNGYSVTGTFTALTNSSSSSYTIPYSTTVATSGSDTWSATITPTVGGTAQTAKQPASGTAGNIMTSSTVTPAAGDSFTAVYKVGVSATKEAGTYSGTATYAMTSNS